MNAALVWNNLLNYCLQIGVVVAFAALVPTLLRLRSSGARLAFWQAALVACLILPAIRPWRQEIFVPRIDSRPVVSGLAAPGVANSTPEISLSTLRPPVSFGKAALAVFAGGALIGLCLLMIGLWRLRLFRRSSVPLSPAPAWRVEADLRLSPDVSGPVTFGCFRPVILLPLDFPRLEQSVQDAILCHEVMHIRRRDWLFAIAEEFVRAVFWFHPAIWWLLSEIQLAREQVVDRAAIEITQAPEEYMDALVVIASGPGMNPELAPAPAFLRRRHLTKRVVAILHESPVSESKLISLFFAGLAILTLACWLITDAIPLSAAPQIMPDPASVTVSTNGAELMHRAPVIYPSDAIAKGVQGTVIVQVQLDSTGDVSDASVLSGPEELRKPVLQSVLSWHFTKDNALASRQVSVSFRLPVEAPSSQTSASTNLIAAARPNVESRFDQTPPLKSVSVTGLSDRVRDELLSLLPVHEGDPMTTAAMQNTRRAVNDFDSHLAMTATLTSSGWRIAISAPSASVAGGFEPRPLSGPQVSNIDGAPVYTAGNGVRPPILTFKVDPEYSEEARKAKYGGAVMLSGVVETDGTFSNAQVARSLGMGLDEKAIEAVSRYRFVPGALDGVPVRIKALIEINFRLL